MAEPIRHSEHVTEAEAADIMAFANGALGAAGHEVTDPYLNEVAWQHARGEISGDKARELSRSYVLGR